MAPFEIFLRYYLASIAADADDLYPHPRTPGKLVNTFYKSPHNKMKAAHHLAISRNQVVITGMLSSGERPGVQIVYFA